MNSIEEFTKWWLANRSGYPTDEELAIWQAGRASMRDEAVDACKNEHLADPQDREDDAYDNAIFDCMRAVKEIKT